MKNLRSTQILTGYAVHARDGEIGKVRELYFDDAHWLVRYIVVDTNRWLPGHRVLLPSSMVDEVRWEDRELRVSVTRDQVKNSPRVDTDKPVAMQHRAEEKAQRRWPLYLAGEAIASVPEALVAPAFEPVNRNGKPFDPHLRATRVVTGLEVRGQDGIAGRVADFVLDDDGWAIRYLVIDVGGKRRVLLMPHLVTGIRIEESAITIDLPAQVVADCPAFNPAMPLTREHEEAVAEHYRTGADVPT
jgi:hypothetical protein